MFLLHQIYNSVQDRIQIKIKEEHIEFSFQKNCICYDYLSFAPPPKCLPYSLKYFHLNIQEAYLHAYMYDWKDENKTWIVMRFICCQKQCSANSWRGKWKVGNRRDLILLDPKEPGFTTLAKCKKSSTNANFPLSVMYTFIQSCKSWYYPWCQDALWLICTDYRPLMMLKAFILVEMVLRMMRRLRMEMMLWILKWTNFELSNDNDLFLLFIFLALKPMVMMLMLV